MTRQQQYLAVTLLGWTTLLSGVRVYALNFPYLSCFEIASQQHDIGLDLLLAVAAVESGWDADARSNANAHGVMQIRWPLTARHLGAGRVAELYNPCLNISLGAQYLQELSGRYKRNTQLLLAAYNYGPSRIQSESDVPSKVQTYVERVMTEKRRIAHEMNRQAPSALHSKQILEVIRFDNTRRAERYLRVLVKQVPDARLTLQRGKAGEGIVYLDTTGLTAEARHRLATLLPDLDR